MQKLFEINGNLDDSDSGINNYVLFEQGIIMVKKLFSDSFGEECLSKIPIYIDNATEGSGHTPIITPVLNKILMIKLGICANSNLGQIVYQFSHELTHAIFFYYYGLNKPRAINREESICSAVSLISIKELCPNYFEKYLKYVSELKNTSYRDGINIAESCSFNLNEINKMIVNFDEYKQRV